MRHIQHRRTTDCLQRRPAKQGDRAYYISNLVTTSSPATDLVATILSAAILCRSHSSFELLSFVFTTRYLQLLTLLHTLLFHKLAS